MVAPTLIRLRFERSPEWVLRSWADALAEGPRGQGLRSFHQDDIGGGFRTFKGLSRMLRTRRASSLTSL
jgi:hypothetical protein